MRCTESLCPSKMPINLRFPSIRTNHLQRTTFYSPITPSAQIRVKWPQIHQADFLCRYNRYRRGASLRIAKTEQRSPRSRGLDRKSTLDILRVLNREDARVAPAV